jgi:CSLREA domain-containing protein
MRARRLAASASAALLLVLGSTIAVESPAVRAGSHTIVVTTTEDELNSDGDCSLREAVVAANTNAPVDACPAGTPGHDLIELTSGATYTLTIAGAGEDAAATGDLDILEPLTILVSGEPAVIDGGGLDRIFDVGPDVAHVSFWLLELRNGDAGSEDGGAIRFQDSCGSSGNDFVIGGVIADNRAASGGGVSIGACRDVEVSGVSLVGNAAADVGGAILMAGEIAIVQNSTLSGNAAGASGGALSVADASFMSILYATIADNAAPTGAAISSRDTSITLNTSVVADNAPGACAVAALAGNFAISDDPTCPTPLSAPDVGLEPLAIVAGYPVHRLALGSPARDVDARPVCASDLTFDQLGTRRPQDGDGDGIAACDAGAIEALAVPVASPPASPPALPDTAAAAPPPTGAHLVLLVAWFAIGARLGVRLGLTHIRRR